MKQGLILCLLTSFSLLLHAQDEEILPIDTSNIQSIREELIHAVYGDEAIPEFRVLAVHNSKSIVPPNYPSENIGNIEVGMVKLKHGFISRIYIIHPAKDNGLNVPIIYHSGHGFGIFGEDLRVNFAGDSIVGRHSIDYFLARGFTVIGVSMPFYGENRSPMWITENNSLYPIYGHNDIFHLKNPFYYFMAPTRAVVDYMQANRNANEFVMYGLSGGGWSTTLYSAMDKRIRLSFPIAGSIPIPLRGERDIGDVEQYYPPFYNRFNYSTLYFLGAAGKGRKQYQVLIKKDHCCFAFDARLYWESKVKAALKNSGIPGSYEFFFDTVSNTHRISALAVDSMQYHIINSMINEKMSETFLLSTSRESNTICEDDTMRLNLPETGTNRVEWYYNGEKVDTADSYGFKLDKEGSYYAKVYSVSGGVTSTEAVEIKRQKVFSKPEIVRQGNKIYSSYAAGNIWYLNGRRVAGSHSNALQLVKPGRYTLRVSAGNCTSDFSEPYDFGVSVFPNPSSTSLTIRVPLDLQTVYYSLRTAQGAEVLNGQFVGETVVRYNTYVKPGIYYLQMKNRDGFSSVQKVVVGK